MAQHDKADKVTVEERVNTVLGLIYRGWHTPKIVQNVAKAWGIEEREAYNYMRKARTRIAAIYRRQQEHGLEDMLARHNDLRDRAYQDRDHRLVLDTDKEDAKLLGLYAPTKVDVSVRDLDAEIERQLAALAATEETSLSGETEGA